jgi:hypothetical protein
MPVAVAAGIMPSNAMKKQQNCGPHLRSGAFDNGLFQGYTEFHTPPGNFRDVKQATHYSTK